MFRHATAVKALLALAAAVAVCASASAALKPGDAAPEFKLFGIDYTYHSLARHPGAKAVALVFTCNHCPVAKRYEDKLIATAKTYQEKGVVFLAINTNPADMVPADSFPKMQERAKEKGFPYPYLYDETQEVSRAYGAAVTPHIFVVSAPNEKGERTVLYVGPVDNRGNDPQVLTDALDDILAGREVKKADVKPFGCSVKYRKKAE